MVKIGEIRFKNVDKYGNLTFICNDKYNSDSYKFLKTLSDKLNRLYPDEYNPIYHNDEFKYCIIQCSKNNKFTLNDDNIYKIEFDICKKNVDDKTYLNCILKSAKFVKKISKDYGEVINLELD